MKFDITSCRTGERLYKAVHKSGLPVCVIPKPGFSKTYATIAANFGSVDNSFVLGGDRVDLPDGIAHFLEHKLFESEEGNAFDLYAKTGASANAYTSFDKTAYLFSCTDNFDESFKILLELMQSPFFTPENVEKEQGIIGQEIRMYDDDPDWQSLFTLLGIMFKNNPVRIDIAGTSETISHITSDLLYRTYYTFYHPSNMALCVVGDVEPEHVFELVEGNFKMPREAEPVENIPFDEPEGPIGEYVEKRLDVSMPIVNIGFKDNDGNYHGRGFLKREMATDILLEMLAGKSSPLYNDLYEKGLITPAFGTEYMSGRGFGLSMFSGPTCDPETVKNAVISACESLAADFDEALFERAKRVVYAGNLRIFDSVESIANAFVSSYLNGISLFDAVEIFDEITADDARDIISRHFTQRNMAVSVILPK